MFWKKRKKVENVSSIVEPEGYEKGDKVTIVVGHPVWETRGGKPWVFDLEPELKGPAIVDSKFTRGEHTRYRLYVSGIGYRSWFSPTQLTPRFD